MSGPLAGLRVVEFAAQGPTTFAGMMLADMGADVIRIGRVDDSVGLDDPRTDFLQRNRRSVCIDLKHPDGRHAALQLVGRADAVIEGFRPGTMERLDLGPAQCHEVNPRLVYGRVSSWGQDGPFAPLPGHDINFVAVTGILHSIGHPPDRPAVPLNVIGSFGGGGMFLAYGVVCALLETQRSGVGQVVDASLVEGTSVLATMIHSFMAKGEWQQERGTNFAEGAAHWYDVYECADGKFVALGALETPFYDRLVELSGYDGPRADHHDRQGWPAAKKAWSDLFRTKSRDEWSTLLETEDTCFSPVLDFIETRSHPQMLARGSFTEVEGYVQPAPAPRLSRTPGAVDRSPSTAGEHTDEVLQELGLSAAAIAHLRSSGAVG
jgi:alpha-methylacyl-CoA racemase